MKPQTKWLEREWLVTIATAGVMLASHLGVFDPADVEAVKEKALEGVDALIALAVVVAFIWSRTRYKQTRESLTKTVGDYTFPANIPPPPEN